jgi:hypothetical protein
MKGEAAGDVHLPESPVASIEVFALIGRRFHGGIIHVSIRLTSIVDTSTFARTLVECERLQLVGKVGPSMYQLCILAVLLPESN